MITVASMSHRTAPLGVRERLAIDADRTSSVLGRARDRFGGAVILDTCNRLEIYVSGERRDDDVLGFLARELGVESAVAGRSFRISRGAAAVRHLCRVACGLESMVLGESEVLGQVRGALSSATAAGATDRTLAHLFHVAIRAGRRARAETAIGRHSLSVSSLAVRELQEHIPNLRAAAALVIGAGEAARLAAQSLATLGVRDLVVVNRTRARAEALADDVGGRAVPWSELADALAGCDVAIGAIGAIGASGGSGHALDREAIRAAAARRDGPPLLLIDLGVPRVFDPAARRLPGVTYRDLDDLQERAARNGARRLAEVPAVERIVEEDVSAFVAWAAQRDAVPTIRMLAQRAEQLRRTQVDRALHGLDLSDGERARFEEFAERLTRSLTRQLLHAPIASLREAALRAGGDPVADADAVRRLFRLDERLDEPDGGLHTDP